MSFRLRRRDRNLLYETEVWHCICDDLAHYGERLTVHVMECPECGRTYEHVNGDYEYCPHCGIRFL